MKDVSCRQSESLAPTRIKLLKNSYGADQLISSIGDIECISKFDKIFEDENDYDFSYYLSFRTQASMSVQSIIDSEKCIVKAIVQLGSNGKNIRA